MITSPESNVVLTDEQTASIDASKLILANLEGEITHANRALSIVKKDLVKAQEALTYEESQLNILTAEVTQKKSELENLNASLVSGSEEATTVRQESEKLTAFSVARKNELDVREIDIAEKESDLSVQIKAMDEAKEQLIASQDAVEKAKAAFSEAALTITWK